MTIIIRLFAWNYDDCNYFVPVGYSKGSNRNANNKKINFLLDLFYETELM